MAVGSVDSLPSFVTRELQLSSPTQKFTFLSYVSHTGENIPGLQLKCTHGPGNKARAITYHIGAGFTARPDSVCQH